jgi:hypothetical protein
MEVDWIYVAYDKDKWRDFVNTVMNIWLAKKGAIS